MSIDHLSLRARLLLTVLLPVLLLAVAMTSVSLSRGARLADSEITERGVAIVSFVAPAAEYGVISGSRGSLDGLMLALKAQKDVAAAVLYDRRGDELVRLGVPASEIAFMQDYKKTEAKHRLFADVNAGKIRFLIGSSETMGTGVNAQLRLKALHHLDVPWLPSQIEQREGRSTRWQVRNVMMNARAVMDLMPSNERPVVDLKVFDAATLDYAGAVRERRGNQEHVFGANAPIDRVDEAVLNDQVGVCDHRPLRLAGGSRGIEDHAIL